MGDGGVRIAVLVMVLTASAIVGGCSGGLDESHEQQRKLALIEAENACGLKHDKSRYRDDWAIRNGIRRSKNISDNNKLLMLKNMLNNITIYGNATGHEFIPVNGNDTEVGLEECLKKFKSSKGFYFSYSIKSAVSAGADFTGFLELR
jgi:hypothetical protein